MLLYNAEFCPKPLGSAYNLRIKRFKKWVDKDPRSEKPATTGGKYLTRHNIDLYFLLVLKNQTTIEPQNLRKEKDAMIAYANNYEYPPPRTPFHVVSQAVSVSIEMHKQKFIELRQSAPQCAHRNLRSNVLDDEDKKKLISYAMSNPSWLDYCSSKTTMCQTTLRGDHLRMTRCCDIRYDKRHGPPKDITGANFPMIGIIQQAFLGKKPTNLKFLRGMWRHRHWWLCGTFWTGSSIVYKFAHDPEFKEMSFHHKDSNINPAWYTLNFIKWNTYDQMYTVYKRTYDKTGVSWAKCTHLRRQGVDDAQRNRVDSDDIRRQTGHSVGSAFDDSYSSEASPVTLQGLSGYSENNPYYCARWYIDINDKDYPLLPEKHDTTNTDLARLLMGDYERQCQEYRASPVQWECGENFLFQLLPFLSCQES